MLHDAACEICNGAEETAAHIMFGCSFAASFWAAINIDLPPDMTPMKLHLLPPAHIPGKHFHTFPLAVLLATLETTKQRHLPAAK